ncbi:MAG: pyridoxal phosphate-dependent aminotransferase [Burkholderiaceae bacterium]
MDRSHALALAARTGNIEPFYVMELMKHAHTLELAGRNIIHMSVGEPDFTAPQIVIDALAAAMQRGDTHYTAATGIYPLRRAIAQFLKARHGVDIDPARIIVTAGASGALLLTMAAVVDPGREILMPDPSYPCNRHFVAAFDGVAKLIPSGPEHRFQLTAGVVEQHWTAATRGVLIASPSNPTGTSIAPAELQRIIETVAARKGIAIVDEIYLELSYEGVGEMHHRSALEFSDDVIVINSFSKYFHMTGWRLGWAVVPESMVPTFEKLAQNFFICASTPAQYAALACFEPEALAIYEARKEEFKRRRDYIVPALRAIGFEVPVTPDGAFYVYADCSRFLTRDLPDSNALALHILDEGGVALVPGKDFGHNQPERWLRLSYATSMENLREAVARMTQLLVGDKRSVA